MMAEQVASCSPPEMAPSQFYSKKTPIPEGRGRQTAKNTGTRPKGIIQALGLDRARVNNSSMPFLHRKSYLDQQLQSCDRMYSTDISGHHGCVNALAFSKGEQFLGTGGDDQRVLVWRVPEAIQGQANLRPICMSSRHRSNIFTIDFSCDNAFIFSGGEDTELIKHDFSTGQFVNSYDHTEAVYSVSAHPSAPEVVMTASEDGCVYIIDTRLPRREVGHEMVLCENIQSYQCVAINPVEHRLVAVMNSRSGSSLYDTRNRKEMVSYNTTSYRPFQVDGVSVCFNSTGTKVFSMYRHHTPLLHELWESAATCYYTDSHGKYRNAVTMKSGCFMGQNDEYVVSGSDDFGVYIWKVPNTPKLTAEQKAAPGFVATAAGENPHLVLPGHRSIVNQTRYSKVHQVLASSGVEKVVKLWSASPLNGKNVGHTPGDPPARRRYTSLELRLMMSSSSSLEPRDPTQEDPKVLALFDSLVEEEEEDIEYNRDIRLMDHGLSYYYQRYVNNGFPMSDSDSEDSWLGDDALRDTYGSEADDWMDSSSSSEWYGEDHGFGFSPFSQWAGTESDWDEWMDSEGGGEGMDSDIESSSDEDDGWITGVHESRLREDGASTEKNGLSGDGDDGGGSDGGGGGSGGDVREGVRSGDGNGLDDGNSEPGTGASSMRLRSGKDVRGGASSKRKAAQGTMKTKAAGGGSGMKTRAMGRSSGVQGTSTARAGYSSGGGDGGVGGRMKTRSMGCSNSTQGTSGSSGMGERMKTRSTGHLGCSNGAQGTSGGSGGMGERMKTRCSNDTQGTSGGSGVGERMKTRCSNGTQGTSGGSGVGERMKTRCSNGAQGTSGGSGVGERMKTRCSNGTQGTSGGSGVGERMKTRSTSHLGCSNGAQGTKSGASVGGGGSGMQGVKKGMTDEKEACSNGSSGAKKMKTEAAGCSGELEVEGIGAQGGKTEHPAPHTSSSSNGVMGARTNHPWMAGLCPLGCENVTDVVVPHGAGGNCSRGQSPTSDHEVVQNEVHGRKTTRSASKRQHGGRS